MNTEQNPQKQLSALQRIENMENGLMSLYQTVDNMARDLIIVRDGFMLLVKKSDAMIKALNSGQGVSEETINKFMIEANVEELSSKVTSMIEAGILVAESNVTENSFVVGREVDDAGTIVNPRLQFALSSIPADIREKLLGATPGETRIVKEGKLKFEVLETYTIRQPEAVAEAPAPSEEASAQ